MAKDRRGSGAAAGVVVDQIVLSGTCEIDGKSHHVMGFTYPDQWADNGCSVSWSIGPAILGPFEVQGSLPAMIDQLLRTPPDPEELHRRYREECRRLAQLSR